MYDQYAERWICMFPVLNACVSRCINLWAGKHDAVPQKCPRIGACIVEGRKMVFSIACD